MAYFVYWIVSGRLSYIGATVAPQRRLRQHNGELAGGARRTRSRTDWRFKCIVSGFRTWQEALQFEWAFKYRSRRCRGVESRALALTALMERERWTSNAPLASDVPLRVEYDPCAWEPPAAEAPAVPLAEALAAAPPAAAPPAAAPPTKARGRGGRRKGWKKTLRGVGY